MQYPSGPSNHSFHGHPPSHHQPTPPPPPQGSYFPAQHQPTHVTHTPYTAAASPYPTTPIQRAHKRLIICCDGTWQDGVLASDSWRYTNILKLARCMHHEDARVHPPIPQILFYQSGVGSEQNLYSKWVDGVLGASLAEKVEETYAFLAHNYAPGDEVFIFGFSRGAYTARLVAGMIEQIGILTRENMDEFAEVFVAFQMSAKSKDPKEKAKYDAILAPYTAPNAPGRLRVSAGHTTFAIKLLAVFDTVGAHGLPKEVVGTSVKMHLLFDFPDKLLGPHIERVLHAMALNETRADFDVAKFYQTDVGKARGQVLRQCWFAGNHSDIGGGWQEHDLSDITLFWIVAQVQDILSIDLNYLVTLLDEAAPWGELTPHDSRKGIHKLYLPSVRKITRNASTLEIIHPSVLRQKAMPADLHINDFQDLVVGLLPLEEHMMQRWGQYHSNGQQASGKPTGTKVGEKMKKSGFRHIATKAEQNVRVALGDSPYAVQEKFLHKISRHLDDNPKH